MKFLGFACAMALTTLVLPHVIGIDGQARRALVEATAGTLGSLSLIIGVALLAPALIVRYAGWQRFYSVIAKLLQERQ